MPPSLCGRGAPALLLIDTYYCCIIHQRLQTTGGGLIEGNLSEQIFWICQTAYLLSCPESLGNAGRLKNCRLSEIRHLLIQNA